ncbi:MAG TPA: GHMP kinase [Nitrospirae bacterium]|nr:GHMP kinase [Nitrospirota bacterium]
MIISRTPLRISFAGGGTDIGEYYSNGSGPGVVVSAAINKYIYITVNKKFDDLIRVSYSRTEIVDTVDKVEHNIIREALKIAGVEKGIEIVYVGDIPLGSAGVGLGSSSGLAVGALNALYAFQGKHASAERLAREACQIEIDTLQHPIGKQDQYITAYGGINYIQFNSDESVFVDPVICRLNVKEELNKRLMLFYTGIERISSTILKEQKASIKSKLEYHHKMVDMAKSIRECLMRGDFDSIGEILHEAWLLKKKLASGISTEAIDKWYESARRAGALGGKIVGAGGGGFLLLYCHEEKQDNVRLALSDLKESPFKFEGQGSKIIYVHD